MTTITNYNLLYGTGSSVDIAVRDAIQDGWQPFGSPYCDSTDTPTHYQAVVTYADD